MRTAAVALSLSIATLGACGGKTTLPIDDVVEPITGDGGGSTSTPDAVAPSEQDASSPPPTDAAGFCKALSDAAAKCDRYRVGQDSCLAEVAASCDDLAAAYSPALFAAAAACASTLPCDKPLLESRCLRDGLAPARLSQAQLGIAASICDVCGGGSPQSGARGLQCSAIVDDRTVPWGAFITAMSDGSIATIAAADCFPRTPRDGSEFFRCTDQFVACAVAQLPGAALTCTR